MNDLPRPCGCARAFGYDGRVSCICDPRYETGTTAVGTESAWPRRVLIHEGVLEQLAQVEWGEPDADGFYELDRCSQLRY
jgi:hypothetical protein